VSHLWEAKHAYYCNEGNHYANGCGSDYKRWSDFLDEEADMDMDYNLVFRWDWVEGEDEGAEPFDGDVNYRNGILKVFFMGQRKGAYRWATVQVCRADEHAVRAFLEPRYRYLMRLWAPFETIAQEAP